jgi:hypothetical protein
LEINKDANGIFVGTASFINLGAERNETKMFKALSKRIKDTFTKIIFLREP